MLNSIVSIPSQSKNSPPLSLVKIFIIPSYFFTILLISSITYLDFHPFINRINLILLFLSVNTNKHNPLSRFPTTISISKCPTFSLLLITSLLSSIERPVIFHILVVLLLQNSNHNSTNQNSTIL